MSSQAAYSLHLVLSRTCYVLPSGCCCRRPAHSTAHRPQKALDWSRNHMLSLAPAAFVLLLALFVGSNVVSSAPGPPGLPPRDAPTAARCKPTSHHVVNSTKAATDLAEHLEFCGGTHVTVDWHGLVHIAQTLVARNGTRLQIRSSVSGLAVIDGQGTARLLTVRTGAELQLKDLVLQNGYALSSGGAVHVETGAKLLVDSCTFQLNGESPSMLSPTLRYTA
eukprot:TRINITY_DN814_c0_g1_i3.p1 TRINITY_DN814_c0_g1~~TRINITY_DN814_c0_g1_i3.p1  ORF type:complete len:222 (+),score=8.61 TRINITY_DN814_c0_g1_i3:1104-1769(+)